MTKEQLTVPSGRKQSHVDGWVIYLHKKNAGAFNCHSIIHGFW
jgi:hypothetical protein